MTSFRERARNFRRSAVSQHPGVLEEPPFDFFLVPGFRPEPFGFLFGELSVGDEQPLREKDGPSAASGLRKPAQWQKRGPEGLSA